MAGSSPTVAEIWIYPIKACQGISVRSATLTDTGFVLDREWCIVDLDGRCAARMEAISQRRIPVLASVRVELGPDGNLVVTAAEMPELVVNAGPVKEEEAEMVEVECSGKSTTTGLGWSFGFEKALENKDGSAWFSEYLNRPTGKEDRRLHGQDGPVRFAFLRSMGKLHMEDYPPIFPLLERAQADPEYKSRLKGNRKRFSDFAPLLLVTRPSCRFIAQRCEGFEGELYPVQSMRGNLVVDGCEAWAEECWKQIVIRSSGSDGDTVPLMKIKECPRCTSPCRDQTTGDWVFPGDMLKLWRVLGKAFPRKKADPEWGSWAGPFCGVYFGNRGREATVRVGDSIEIRERCKWDDHLKKHWRHHGLLLALGVGAASYAVFAWMRARHR